MSQKSFGMRRQDRIRYETVKDDSKKDDYNTVKRYVGEITSEFKMFARNEHMLWTSRPLISLRYAHYSYSQFEMRKY